jgi:cephalosporin-C deacetylase-like acetyl esterase
MKPARAVLPIALVMTVAAAATVPAQKPQSGTFVSELDKVAQRYLKERASAIAAIKDPAAADARKKFVREKVLSLIGGLPDYRGPLNPRVTKTTPREGYAIEHVMFESLPGYVVTANLYRPDTPGRHPAVLMSMGHWESGKGAGQLLSANLARRGFVVLAYDPAGQGERQQAYDPRFRRSVIGGPTDQHFSNGAAAILMGQAVSRYFIHDGMRAIDYLISRPEVDPERIGATGCSGGGTQTTYISALDPRVKVAAVACYMNSFQTLFPGPSLGDSEQSVPGFIAAGLDQTYYVELFAPKPWLFASTEDDFLTTPGARQVFEEAQRWYELHDAKDRVKWVVGPGGHGTPPIVREAIYDWMTRWLKPDAPSKPTAEVTDLLPDDALLVTEKGQVDSRELYEIIKETPRSPGSQAELSAFVSSLMAANPPIAKTSKVLSASRPGRQPAVVLVQGSLEAGPDAEALKAGGSVVALLRNSGTGDDSTRPFTGNWMNNTRAWLVGRNLPATHAAEINAMVAELEKRDDVDPARISVRARGVAGVAVLLAAAVNPRISSVELTRTPYSVRAAIESPIHMHLHDAVIPGFAVKWDLGDLRTLLGTRTVEWRDPTDWMGNVVKVDGAFVYLSSDPNVTR